METIELRIKLSASDVIGFMFIVLLLMKVLLLMVITDILNIL